MKLIFSLELVVLVLWFGSVRLELGRAQESIASKTSADLVSAVEGRPDPNALLNELDRGVANQTRLEQESVSLAETRSRTRDLLRSQTRALYMVYRAGILCVSGAVDSLVVQLARVERFKYGIRKHIAELRELDRQSGLLRERAAALSASLEQTRSHLTEARRQSLLALRELTAKTVDARSPNRERADPSGPYGLRVLDAKPESAFARERGNLAPPVSGEFSLRDARREESEGPGLEFLVRPGTAVRSCAAGRVAFSDLYGSYGRLVILDHGDNYYTVYGNLANVEVRVGDDLSKGARIGTVGSGRPDTALFFEVRRGTKALAPRSWLGL